MNDDDIKRGFAETNGLVFDGDRFYKVGLDGKRQEVAVTEADLNAYRTSVTETDNIGEQGGTEGAVKQNSSKALGVISQAADMGRTLLSVSPNVQNQSGVTQTVKGVTNTVTDIISKADPTVGAVMKVGAFANDALKALGLGTDGVTVADQIIDGVPVLGAVNGLFGKRTRDFHADNETIADVGGSYGGTVGDIHEAEEKARKKYGLFSSSARKKANAFINEAERKQSLMADIADDVRDQEAAVASMGDLYSNAYAFQLAGGFNPKLLRAEKGAKIEEPFVPDILDRIVPGAYRSGGVMGQVIDPASGGITDWTPEIIGVWEAGIIPAKREGGRIESQQKSVIPDGALHKNRHHIENADGFTKKGIPVVDDTGVQQAEIERDEIIFTKEVTEKLEELCKKYCSEDSTAKEKDEAAVEAGKLVAEEIMLNTDDRTGLIDAMQQGGKLGKPSYEDWLKTVPEKAVDGNYDLALAFEVLPFERLERWRKELLKDIQSDDFDSWHLPSVAQQDDSTYVYLKKGRTVRENPELAGEFDFYRNDRKFHTEWKMVFDPEHNRWTYRKRTVTK